MKHCVDLRLVAAAVVAMAIGGERAGAGLVLTIEAPGVQQTAVTGVTTETFDTLSGGYFGGPLVTAVGTITTSGRISTADQYGGAGGINQYLNVGYGTGTELLNLDLNGDQAYFGFWWSAADPGNSVAFYADGVLLGSFDSATTLAALNLNSAYRGNPNAAFLGQNMGENYVYLNVFGTDATTFDQIVFTNSDRGTGFEMDNFSVRESPVVPPIGTPIPGGIKAVPEPASLAMLALGGIGLLAKRMHRRTVVAA